MLVVCVGLCCGVGATFRLPASPPTNAAVASPHTPPRADDILTSAGAPYVSVQDDRLPVAPLETIDARLDALAACGMRVTRVDVLLNELVPERPARPRDPTDPAYRFERLDRTVDGLTRRGIAVILNLYRAPAWTNGGRRYEWAPEPDAYGDIVEALLRRYAARRVDGVPVSLMLEPWNEPQLAWFFRPQWRAQAGRAVPASPARYAALVRAARAARERVGADVPLLGVSGASSGVSRPPEGAVGMPDFLAALAADGPLGTDAYSQHIYPAGDPRTSPALTAPGRLGELIDRAAPAVGEATPVLITEAGYLTAPSEVRDRHVDETTQAAWAEPLIRALAAQERVRLVTWFNWEDNAGWPAGLHRDGGAAKPSRDVVCGLIGPDGRLRAPAADTDPLR